MAAPKAPIQRNTKINGEILQAAKHVSPALPPELLFAIFWQESHYDPAAQNPTTSACGLAQITKDTGRRLGLKDCHDIRQSVRASAQLLSSLETHFSESTFRSVDPLQLAVAAYHVGPDCVDRSFNGSACTIVGHKPSECPAIKAKGGKCVYITYGPCTSAIWTRCIPIETRQYLQSVYEELMPLARTFVLWREATDKVELLEATQQTLTSEIVRLSQAPSGSPADAKRAILEKQLEHAIELLKSATNNAGAAKAAFDAKYRTLSRRFVTVQADYDSLHQEAQKHPGTVLFERDAQWHDNSASPCAIWTVYVDDRAALRHGSDGVDVSYPLPDKWSDYVSGAKHGGYVTLEFQIDAGLKATNVRAQLVVGEEFEPFARDLLTTYKIAGESPEEFIFPDQFHFSRCVDEGSTRAITFIFGNRLDSGLKEPSKQITTWSVVAHTLGSIRNLKNIYLESELFVDGEPDEESLTKVYVTQTKNGKSHVCRRETQGLGKKKITVIAGQDYYEKANGKVTHTFEPFADDDCVPAIIPNAIDSTGNFVDLGSCTFSQLPKNAQYDCFVKLSGDSVPESLYAVNVESYLPELILDGEKQQMSTFPTEFKDLGAAELPLSKLYVFSGSPPKQYEIRIVKYELKPQSPDLFNLGKVDQDLGVATPPLVLGRP